MFGTCRIQAATRAALRRTSSWSGPRRRRAPRPRAGALEQVAVARGAARSAGRRAPDCRVPSSCALAADLEVALGELEAVGRLDHRLEPRARGRRSAPPSRRETSRQYDCSAPRPTRPRSWCSCASPKRSASCTIITVAFGDVDADLDHRRRDEHVELARLELRHQRRGASAGLSRPWRQPTRKSRSSPRRSRSASSSAARASVVSDSSISGQTT